MDADPLPTSPQRKVAPSKQVVKPPSTTKEVVEDEQSKVKLALMSSTCVCLPVARGALPSHQLEHLLSELEVWLKPKVPTGGGLKQETEI